MALSPEEEQALREEVNQRLHPQQEEPSFEQNDMSDVHHVIGVISGKGGVGKSLVCGGLAVELTRRGKKVAILDADITGPSIPKMFGISDERLTSDGAHILPTQTAAGVRVASTNLLLENETDPVLWRGPMLMGALRQFWADSAWGSIDCMLVDMPPGTGDVALTVFQSLPIDGVIIVSSPQDLVQMIVGKAVKMARMMDVPVLGIVENMSYYTCPHCGEKLEVFGPSHLDETASAFGLDSLGRLPLDPALAASCDAGNIETTFPEGLLNAAVARVEDVISTEKA